MGTRFFDDIARIVEIYDLFHCLVVFVVVIVATVCGTNLKGALDDFNTNEWLKTIISLGYLFIWKIIK